MAVAVIIDFPDGNAQKYEQVTGKLFPEGKLPQGWQVHIAGPAGNGWQVSMSCHHRSSSRPSPASSSCPPPSK